MRIFDNLPFFKNKKSEVTDYEARLYHRHMISDERLAYIDIGGNKYKVIDISYSGIAVEVINDSVFKNNFKLSGYLNANLCILSAFIPIKVKLLYLGEHRAGGLLVHDSDVGLLQLREPLELMRRGSDLAQVNEEFLKQKNSDLGWQYFHGGTADDLRIKFVQDKVNEALLSILINDHYEEIVWFDEKLTTRHAEKPELIGINIDQDSLLDVEVVQRGICVLLGVVSSYPDNVGLQKLLQECVKQWMQSRGK